MKFRALRADEIECRVQSVKPNGAVLLLYKTARTDMDILDETVGAENWQCEFYEVKGIMFCRVGVNTNYDKQDAPDRWIWKSDAGSESNQDAEKGNASDARKRAGFALGIGRELYSAPFIWIPSEKCNIVSDGKSAKCFDKFEVAKVAIENGEIIGIRILNKSKKDDNGNPIVAFSWAKVVQK